MGKGLCRCSSPCNLKDVLINAGKPTHFPDGEPAYLIGNTLIRFSKPDGES